MIISGVIKLLFDEIQFAFQSKKSSNQSAEFLKQNYKQAYSKVIDIYKIYYTHLKDLMPEFLTIIITPIKNPHEVNSSNLSS